MKAKTVAQSFLIFLVAIAGAFLLDNHLASTAVTQAATLARIASDEPMDRSPEVYQGNFLDTSTTGMLVRLKVAVFSEDRVVAFPDPSLGVGSLIRVYRAQPVTLKDGNVTSTVRTWAKTMAEFADEQRLDLADKDIMQPPLGSAFPEDEHARVTVTRVAERELTVMKPVAFTTKYIDDPTIERGINSTEQKGVAGNLKSIYLVRRENGKEVSRKVLSRETTLAPVQEVIRRGTKIVVLDRGEATFCNPGVGRCGLSMMAAHKTLPFGTRVRVVNVTNGKSVVVTINDRGPFLPGRVIDLAADAFAQIASISTGHVNVRVEKE